MAHPFGIGIGGGLAFYGTGANIAAGGSDAETLAGGETDALAIVYTDDHFKATTGFNGSVYCVDSGTPANDYDSSPTTETASYFTYTSPSPKMILHDDGVLKYNAHNLYLNSASPANQSITVVSSATYAVTITGSVSVTASGAATGTWTAGTNTFTAATTTLTLGSTSGSGTVHVRRTPSDSIYMETAGSIRYADPIEFNSSGTALGALVEPQRTNLLTYSSQFDNAAWNAAVGNCTISANAIVAPNGVSSADGVIADSGSNTFVGPYSSNVGASATKTTSCYIKPGNKTWCYFWNFSGADRQFFQLSGSGSVGTRTGTAYTNATIEALPDGWYRITATGTLQTNVGINFSDSDNTTTCTGDGATISGYVWGAQAELGSSATSMIETFSASVTRAADNISKAISAFPTDTANMTIYMAFRPVSYPGTVNLISINDGTTNDRFYSNATTFSDPRFVVASGGSIQANSIIGTAAAGSSHKLALAYQANSANGALNGTAATEDTSVTIPTGSFTTLNIGAGEGGNAPAHCYVEAVLILPRRVSDADMQTLTATGALP